MDAFPVPLTAAMLPALLAVSILIAPKPPCESQTRSDPDTENHCPWDLQPLQTCVRGQNSG